MQSYERLVQEQRRRLSGAALELLEQQTSTKGVDLAQRMRLVPHVVANLRSVIDAYGGDSNKDVLLWVERNNSFHH